MAKTNMRNLSKAQRRWLENHRRLKNKGYPYLEKQWNAHRVHKARDGFRE